MPAFPDESRLKVEDGIPIYDPKKSVAWTGMMPNLLLRTKGAIRSQFPYNPLVAYGIKAEEMMRQNLDTDLAHGPKSCWGYCVEHHAKVLYLGLPAYHSLTLLHTIEDYNHNDWLPKGWFENRKYLIKDGTETKLQSVKVRINKWSQYLAEKHTEHKYIKAGLIKARRIGGIDLRYIEDAYYFIETIEKNWAKLKNYYLPIRYRNRKPY